MLRVSEIRRLREQYGAEGYLRMQAQLLGLNPDGSVPTGADGEAKFHESIESGGRTVRRRPPEQFSLQALWEGLVGPVEETLPFAQKRKGLVEVNRTELQEQVASTAFPSATGQLIATRVIEGYESPNFIGDQLVDTMDSNLRNERVVGFTSLQGPKPVNEGQAYEGSTYEEKFVTTQETKRGRLLQVTEEAVFFDQTGQILRRAQGIGRKAREERERRIVRGVADVDSNERVYRPDGSAEQLYASANSNVLTGTPLNDWTDIQEALTHHAQNITDDREPDDHMGEQPIMWNPEILLVAQEKAGDASRIVAATQVRGTQGSNEETISGNPLDNLVSGLRVLSSPFLDQAAIGSADQFDDASDWFLGDFRSQFVYKEIWPLQTFRAPSQNEEQWNRDVVARFKVREYGDINALDHRLVIKGDAA